MKETAWEITSKKIKKGSKISGETKKLVVEGVKGAEVWYGDNKN